MTAPQQNIAAFFDLDGTLLPPPSLEWRFIGYLLERDEIASAHVARWLGYFAKTILRDPHSAIAANKFYLAGIRTSLIERLGKFSSPANVTRRSISALPSRPSTHPLAPLPRPPHIPHHRRPGSASANNSPPHRRTNPSPDRSPSHTAGSLAAGVAQPLLAVLFHPMDGSASQPAHEQPSQIPRANRTSRNPRPRPNQKLRLRQHKRRRPHARIRRKSPRDQPPKTPGANRAKTPLAHLPLERTHKIPPAKPKPPHNAIRRRGLPMNLTLRTCMECGGEPPLCPTSRPASPVGASRHKAPP